MKKLLIGLMLMLLLSVIMTAVTLAHQGDPVAGCPPPFKLHHVHEHDQEHEGDHRHIGSNTDRNRDGYICVKHISDEKHLHIDNNVRK
jgi:hypothetical protein